MKHWILSLAIGVALTTTTAHAVEVRTCDARVELDAVVEPWDQNSRSFANGKTRVSLIDTIEPAAAAFWVVVLSPPYDIVGARQCQMIGAGGNLGFHGVHFDTLKASYNPAVGLIFDVMVDYNDPSGVGTVTRVERITLNQATGQINAQFN